MFGAALIALVMISPVIYWNYTHDFISFKYQWRSKQNHISSKHCHNYLVYFCSIANNCN